MTIFSNTSFALETGASLLTAVLFLRFTSSAKAAPLLAGSIFTQIASNTALRHWANKTIEIDPLNGPDQRIVKCAQSICPYMFALLTASHAQALLHELSHGCMARAVFKNAQPQTTLLPFAGGKTKYNAEQLTTFGNKLGKKRALTLVTLAGPAGSLLLSAAAIATGKAFQNTFSEMGRYLIACGRMDFYMHALYALSAMFSPPSRTSHDFVLLAAEGLPPLAATIAMLIIPSLIT